MSKYSEVFKRDAILALSILKEKGMIQMKDIDKTEISNVRQLCYFLGISSWSLYDWEKKFSGLKSQKNDVSDEILLKREKIVKIDDDDVFDDIHYEKETRIASESKRDFFINTSEPLYEKKLKSTGEKDIFGIRYYAWFAKTLEIKNYSRMVLAQLKLAIGIELIGQSKLIDMKKVVMRFKINGDNL